MPQYVNTLAVQHLDNYALLLVLYLLHSNKQTTSEVKMWEIFARLGPPTVRKGIECVEGEFYLNLKILVMSAIEDIQGNTLSLLK